MRTLMRLRHRRIVLLLGAGQVRATGERFVVLQYCCGGDLFTALHSWEDNKASAALDLPWPRRLQLARDVAERHRAQTPPLAQIALLKRSGLATMVLPEEFGGGGAPWPVVVAVARELAAVDGSVGTLFGYHSMNLIHQDIGAGPRRAARLAEIGRDRLWAAGVGGPLLGA